MSASFGRPALIRPGWTVPLPSTRLDHPAGNHAVPSPILIEVLQSQLSTELSTPWSVSGHTVLHAKVDSIQRWMGSFPPVFSIYSPDTSWDAEFSYLPLQRLQLHCSGYMAFLAVLRPLLTTSSPQPETTDCAEGSKPFSESDRRELVGTAIDVALALMTKCRDLFVLCFPGLARNFMVAFCPFDTAATLCSALRHDKDRRALPRRMEIVAAIGCALYISKQLVASTEIGKTTWNILSALIFNVGLSDVEKTVLERAMKAGEMEDSQVGVDAVPRIPEADTLSWEDFDSTRSLWTDDMNDPASSQIDLGALNGAWDWNGLNFNPFYE